MPASVQQLVSDPDFAKLSAGDQAAVVAHFDSDFANVPDAEKATVIDHLQRQALSRPDLAPPPGVQRPQGPNMQESAAAKMFLPQQNPQSPPPAKVPPSIQNAPDWVGEGIGGLTLGGLLAMGGAPPFKAIGRVPYVGPLLQMEAISEARHIPYVGKVIPPYAEMLPFLGGNAAAESEAAAKPPKNAGDPFRNVPKPAPPDVFDVKEPPPPTMPRVAETPAPYRYGPGQIPPEEIGVPPNPRVLAGGRGVITTPRGALPPAPYQELAVPMERGTAVYNGPYTYSGESALRQTLTGLGNKDLLQIAKSRGVDVAKESQLKPGVADSRIIQKVIDDFSPEELNDFRDQYLEATRQGRPGGVGPEAYTTKVLQQFFPDLKIPQTRLARTQKAFANRPRGNTLYDLLNQQ